jgi:uncharacterized protein
MVDYISWCFSMLKKKKILQDLKNLLVEKFGDNIDSVIMYGSRAKGGAGKYSDWDLLVILKNNYDWRLKHDIILSSYNIDLKYDIVSDTKIVSRDELTTLRGSIPYIRHAFDDGISI